MKYLPVLLILTGCGSIDVISGSKSLLIGNTFYLTGVVEESSTTLSNFTVDLSFGSDGSFFYTAYWPSSSGVIFSCEAYGLYKDYDPGSHVGSIEFFYSFNGCSTVITNNKFGTTYSLENAGLEIDLPLEDPKGRQIDVELGPGK